MKIEYAVPGPEKPHVLHVGLRYEAAVDGEDKIHEVLVRKSQYESLTAAKRLAYTQECEKWHHKRDATVRAKWDTDDKARADAATAAAKAAEEAKFVVRQQGFVRDKDGTITGVQVTITHGGHTCTAVIPPDATMAGECCQKAWQESKAKVDEEAAALAAFNIG